MASSGNISKITLPGGNEYDLKVRADNVAPIVSKSYTGVVASANDDPNGWLYFAKIFPDQNNYYKQWRIKYRFTVDMTGVTDGAQYCEVAIVGSRNTYQAYGVWNGVSNTSYRPIYAHVYYSAKQAGVQNGIGHALGVRLQSSYNPTTAGRNFNFELMEAVNCTVSFLDSMVTYANLPGTGSTNYQTRTSFDGTTQGVTISGDRNSYQHAMYIRFYNNTLAGEALPANSIVVIKSDNKLYKAVSGATFDITKPIIWTDTAITNLTTAYYQYYYTQTFDRDLNTAYSGFTATPGAYIYMVVTISGSTATIDSTFLTETLPSSDDGKIYIRIGKLGINSNGHNYFIFLQDKPMFIFKNGAIRIYSGSSDLAFKSDVKAVYTPAGNISKPNVTVSQTKETVSKLSVAGTIPTFSSSLDGETLIISFDAGAMPIFTSQPVVTNATAALSAAPTFTGTQATITSS